MSGVLQKNLIFCALVAALQFGCSTSLVEERSDSDGFGDGDKDEENGVAAPSMVTGAQLTYQNTRVRCGFAQESKDKYRIECRVVAALPSGSEFIPTGIDENLRLSWSQPISVAGSPIDVSACKSSKNNLSYSCNVQLQKLVTTKTQVNLEVSQDLEVKSESDTVLLPYSVSTYGIVSEIPRIFERKTEKKLSLTGTPEKFGFQTVGMDPLVQQFSTRMTMCTIGEKLYFTSSGYIYVYEKEKYTIFAGNVNEANKSDFSGRFSANLGEDIRISCSKDAVYVLANFYNFGDYGNEKSFAGFRILRMSESDLAVEVVHKDMKSLTYEDMFTYFAVSSNGVIYLANSQSIMKINDKSELQRIAGGVNAVVGGENVAISTALINNIKAISVGPDQSLYYIETKSNYTYTSVNNLGDRIRKVNRESLVSTIAGKFANEDNTNHDKTIISDSMLAIDSQLAKVVGLTFEVDGGFKFFGAVGIEENSWGSASQLFQVDAKGKMSAVKNETNENIIATAENFYGAETLLTLAGGKNGIYFLTGEAFGDNDAEVFLLNPKGDLKKIMGLKVEESSKNRDSNDENLTFIRSVEVTKDGEIFAINRAKYFGYIQFIDAKGNLKSISPQLTNPRGGAMGSDGEFYYLDSNGIKKISKLGKISTVTNFNIGSNFADLVFGPKGELFVLDNSFGRIYQIENYIHKEINPIITAVAWDLQVYEILKRYENLTIDKDYSFYLSGGLGYQIVKLVPTWVTSGKYIVENGIRFPQISGIGYGYYNFTKDVPVYYKSSAKVIAGRGWGGEYEDKNTARLTNLSRPSDLALLPNGEIYFAEYGSSRVRYMMPIKEGPFLGEHSIETIVGGLNQVGECGGGISVENQVSADDFEKSLSATLSVICTGRPTAISAIDTCDENLNGSVTIAYAQNFFFSPIAKDQGSSNIVKIVKPCGFLNK